MFGLNLVFQLQMFKMQVDSVCPSGQWKQVLMNKQEVKYAWSY